MSAPREIVEAVHGARERITGASTDLIEVHRELAALLATTRNVRQRGAINHEMWRCERMLGRRPCHFSESGQDAFLDEVVFRGRRDGVFVEVGGYDGVSGSNCLFFELMRGWSGVLIEPSPRYSALAAERRRVPCLGIAVAAQEGEGEFLDVREGFRQMGGLVASYDPKVRRQVEADPRHEGEVISVPVRRLAAVLEERGLAEIDYVSLDVEGAEREVLETFPFERFRIRAWTVENNLGDRAVAELMRARGYARVEGLGVDEVYLRE